MQKSVSEQRAFEQRAFEQRAFEQNVFEQRVAEHMKHADHTLYTLKVGSNSQKCYWCETYADISDNEDCACCFKKCKTCGILCYDDPAHAIVTTCVCSNNKDKFRWREGETSETSCNFHKHHVEVTVTEVTVTEVTAPNTGFSPIFKRLLNNIQSIKFPTKSDLVGNFKWLAKGNIQSTGLKKSDGKESESSVPETDQVIPISASTSTSQVSAIPILEHGWVRKIGKLDKGGCTACECDSDDEHRHSVQLCKCGRIYSGQCSWGVWTNSCTCDSETESIRWLTGEEHRCNHHF